MSWQYNDKHIDNVKVRNTILDYRVDVDKLKESDRVLLYSGANYSVTGK